MDSLITTFHIDWKIIIAQAVNFAVVFVVLYIFAIKPLQKIMSERNDKIAKGITDAKEAQALVVQAKEKHEQNIIKLRKISIDAKAELNKELNDLREASLEIMRKDKDEWVKNTAKQMEMEKIKIVAEAKKDIVSLAMQATEKILSNKKDLKDL